MAKKDTAEKTYQKLEVKEIHHNINYYDENSYDLMQDYLLINNQKEQEHNIR